MAHRRAQKAKKARSENGAAPEPSPQLAEHMRLLGLASVAAYRDWSRAHKFSARLDKTPLTLRREREQVQLRAARAVATSRRRIRDPLDAFQRALDGTLDLELVRQSELRMGCEMLAELAADRPHRAQLPELLTAIRDRADFLLATESIGGLELPYLRGLVALNERRGQWRRDLEAWQPRSHNRRKQFASLLRHLLADYYVPGFLDAAWLRTDAGSYRYRDLFLHVGGGGNPRTAKLPVAFTKKEAHWFLQAPEHYPIEAALRFGQIRARGGSPRLCDAIAATPLGRSFDHEDFWQTVIAFFVANPMLDLAQVGPLIDFIDHRRFRPLEVIEDDGTVREEPPPQPGFSMARRTPESLLRQMERWHTGLGKAVHVGPAMWDSVGVGELRWETGVRAKRCWRIRELRTLRALQVEGRAMGHCVASYATSCARGNCSIWTLELESKDGTEKRLTIELSRQRVVVQARGRHNRTAERQELDVIGRWVEQEALGLGTYI